MGTKIVTEIGTDGKVVTEIGTDGKVVTGIGAGSKIVPPKQNYKNVTL